MEPYGGYFSMATIGHMRMMDQRKGYAVYFFGDHNFGRMPAPPIRCKNIYGIFKYVIDSILRNINTDWKVLSVR